MAAELEVAGNAVAELYSYTTIRGYEFMLQPSNTVELQCNRGDEVLVRAISSGYDQIYGFNSQRRSTFSGCLLRRL